MSAAHHHQPTRGHDTDTTNPIDKQPSFIETRSSRAGQHLVGYCFEPDCGRVVSRGRSSSHGAARSPVGSSRTLLPSLHDGVAPIRAVVSGRACGGELEGHDVVAAPPMKPTTQPPVHAVEIGVA